MPDSLHQPAAEIVARALIDPERYASKYAASIADPEGFWGEEGKRLDWMKPYSRVKNTSFDQATSRSDGSRTASSMSRPTASTATWRPGPSRPRSSGRATTPASRADQLPRAARGVSRFGNVLRGARRRQRRPGRHLPADDPRGRLCDARLRPHRRGAFRRLRRLLRRGAALAHRGLGREAPRHRRRGAARRPPHPFKANADKARPGFPACASWSSAAPGRGALGRRPRHLAARGDGSASPPTARRRR